MKIDELPSDLVSEILSRIPLREAVRTSVLWKKWRYAWSKLPQLVFDGRLFEESIKKTGVKLRMDLSMDSQVPYLLLHHGHLRDKFTLAVSGLPNCRDIDQFILAVLKKGVKVLSVRMINRNSRLPLSIFAYCQQLTYLHLTHGVLEPPLEFNGFSTLSDLKLEEVRVNGSILSSLISNSPLLRTLSFKVSNYNCGHLEIVAPNLESLTIQAQCESLHFKKTPKLLYLKLEEVRLDGSRLSGLISKSPLLRTLNFKVSNYNCGRLEFVAPNLESLTIEAMCESLDFKNTPKIKTLDIYTCGDSVDENKEKAENDEFNGIYSPVDSCVEVSVPVKIGGLLKESNNDDDSANVMEIEPSKLSCLESATTTLLPQQSLGLKSKRKLKRKFSKIKIATTRLSSVLLRGTAFGIRKKKHKKFKRSALILEPIGPSTAEETRPLPVKVKSKRKQSKRRSVKNKNASNLDMFCGRLPAIEELNMDGYYLKYVTGSRASSLLLNDLCNLKALGMHLCFGILDEVVPALCLVKNAKSLVKLDILMNEEENTELNLLDLEGFSEITLDHLREVEVDLKPYLKSEMQFIEFLLARSPVLEKLIMEPRCAKTEDKGLNCYKELSSFHCASPLVEISYPVFAE